MAIVEDSNHPTGLTTTPGDPGGSGLAKRRRDKALAAVDLKVRGYKLEDIAVALGLKNGKAVSLLIDKAFAEELAETDKAQLRAVAGRRLEQAWRSLHDKIADPGSPDHIAAVNAGVKVIDRYSKLMGLDAPTEFIVSTPQAEELNDWVESALAAQRAANGTPILEEGNVLEAEADWEDEDLDDLEGLDEPIPERADA